LLNEFVAHKPDPKYIKIRAKPQSMYTDIELELEQAHLTEKLKQYNLFLNRLVEKHLIEEDVNAGKKRGERKGLTKPVPRVSAIMVLEN
jgi:hypothetical protein